MIDLAKVSDVFGRTTFGRDAVRIGLFMAAVSKRFAELSSNGDFLRAQAFMAGAAVLAASWASAGMEAPKRISLGRLFGWDPFKDSREKVRRFASEWELDPVFREAMG